MALIPERCDDGRWKPQDRLDMEKESPEVRPAAARGDAGLPPSDRSESQPGRPEKQRPAVTEGMALPSAVSDLFSRWLNIKLPPVFIHRNDVAERILNERRAEAMTIGNHIYFRTGRFEPNTPHGLGLLAHELTHVAQKSAGDGRDGGGQSRRETLESEAVANETLVRQNSRVRGRYAGIHADLPLPSRSGPAVAAPPAVPAPGAAAAPAGGARASMFADTARDLDAAPTAPVETVLSDAEVDRIKELICEHLMTRVKEDLERGA
jgi:hypothetical protein